MHCFEKSTFLLSLPATSFDLQFCVLSCLIFSDMRKALSRDIEKKSIIPLKRPITPDELEYD